MQNVTFKRYDKNVEDKLIRCYQTVFAAKPWYEQWSYDQVKQDLEHEITPECSCWLAMAGEDVIGFCWGYPIALDELEAKLKIKLDTTLLISLESKVAYQDELGVLEAFQGQKIGKALFALRNNDFLAQGLVTGIVRTRKQPMLSVTYVWYTQKLDYVEVAQYPSEHGGVVLAATLKNKSN